NRLKQVTSRTLDGFQFDSSGGSFRFRGPDISDLSGFNFSGADLRGINFSLHTLDGIDFPSVRLRNVDFRNADLRGVNFSGVDLRGANFSGADLRGVNFSGTSLIGVNLRGAKLGDFFTSELDDSDGTPRSIRITLPTDITGAFFNFDTVWPDGSFGSRFGLPNLNWIGSDSTHLIAHGESETDQTDLSASNLGNPLALRGFDLSGLNLSNVNFSGLDLSGVSLRDTNLSGATLDGVKLLGALAIGTNFSGVSLGSINVPSIGDVFPNITGMLFGGSTTMPDGTRLEDNVTRDGTGRITNYLDVDRLLLGLPTLPAPALPSFGWNGPTGVEFESGLSFASFIGPDINGVNIDLPSLRALFAVADFQSRGLDLNNILPTDVDLSAFGLSGRDFGGFDFSGLDFGNTGASGVDFSGFELSDFNFSDVNLPGVTLPNIALPTLNLPGFDLRGVSFASSILDRVNFGGGDGSSGSGGGFNPASLFGVNLRGASLSGVSFGAIDLGLDLEGNPLGLSAGLDLRFADLRGISLGDGSDSSPINWPNINLAGANLSGVNLSRFRLPDVTTPDLDLTRFGLGGANLSGVRLDGTLLDNVNFSGAILRGVNLARSLFDGLSLPKLSGTVIDLDTKLPVSIPRGELIDVTLPDVLGPDLDEGPNFTFDGG
ncbi:MAG TPA: pentapeptide repeat-containing protein, partial [Pirellulaceae bacterium]|nr:pentapeptide repeat-containing protein [Pirellulaceae bacterium]